MDILFYFKTSFHEVEIILTYKKAFYVNASPLRLSEKELKEQGSGKLEEWRSTVTPLQEWLSKEEQKLESQESLASDMINLRRQKQEDLVRVICVNIYPGRSR